MTTPKQLIYTNKVSKNIGAANMFGYNDFVMPSCPDEIENNNFSNFKILQLNSIKN